MRIYDLAGQTEGRGDELGVRGEFKGKVKHLERRQLNFQAKRIRLVTVIKHETNVARK